MPDPHDQARSEQGDAGPGKVGRPVADVLVAPRHAGREAAQIVQPLVGGEVPGPPEQPQRPELDGEAQPDPEQVVAGALDHSAACAASAAKEAQLSDWR